MNRYVDGYEALRQMCWGHDAYAIAYHLAEVDGIWKGRDPERGAGRVRSCLSREKKEFFRMSEIIAITRLTRQYDAIWFMCDELGLSRPQPTDVAAQVAQLRETIDDAARRLAGASDSLSRLSGDAPPAIRGRAPAPRPASHFRSETRH